MPKPKPNALTRFEVRPDNIFGDKPEITVPVPLALVSTLLLGSTAYDWLAKNVGRRGVEWGIHSIDATRTNVDLWFRREEDAVLFVLTWVS